MRWALIVLGLLSGGLGPLALPVLADEPPPASADTTSAEARRFDAPTWVMLRSLLVPGWGQAKNGAWLKALLVAGIEGAFVERLAFENRIGDRDLKRAYTFAPDSPERASWERRAERHRDRRRDFIWWTSMFVFLSMGDAYTDAHLKHFDVRLQDESAEGGEDSGAGGGTGIRVGYVTRW